MTNAEKIRAFTDEQLAWFLWIWKINSITGFLTEGGQGGMHAGEIRNWIEADESTFVCLETEVGKDYVFDQNFLPKE